MARLLETSRVPDSLRVRQECCRSLGHSKRCRSNGSVPSTDTASCPGKSLNNREYPRETLVQATPLYEGKPFILDHDIEHAECVVGIITRPRYGVEEGYN